MAAPICHPSRRDLAINLVSRHLRPHLDMAARSHQKSKREHDMSDYHLQSTTWINPILKAQHARQFYGRAVAEKPGRTNSSDQG